MNIRDIRSPAVRDPARGIRAATRHVSVWADDDDIEIESNESGEGGEKSSQGA